MDLSKKFLANIGGQKLKIIKKTKQHFISFNFSVVNGYIVKEKIYNEMKRQGFFEKSKVKEQEYFDYIEDSRKSFWLLRI